MKKISSALVVGLFALVLTMPAKSGYYDSAASAAWANEVLAYSSAQANWHTFLLGYYGWYDAASIYEAWNLASIAKDVAYDAYWAAP